MISAAFDFGFFVVTISRRDYRNRHHHSLGGKHICLPAPTRRGAAARAPTLPLPPPTLQPQTTVYPAPPPAPAPASAPAPVKLRGE